MKLRVYTDVYRCKQMNIDYVTINFYSQPDTNLTLKVFETFFFSKEIWTNTSETMHSMLSNTAKRRRGERRMVKSMESPIFVFPKERNNLPVGKPKKSHPEKGSNKKHLSWRKNQTEMNSFSEISRFWLLQMLLNVAWTSKMLEAQMVIPDVAGSS